MRISFEKLFWGIAASVLVFASCTGGGGDGTVPEKMTFPTPGHLMLDGRTNSVLTIHGVSYPKIDHSRSTPGDLVIVLPDVPPGSTGPRGYLEETLQAPQPTIGVTLPDAQTGEIAHITNGFQEAAATEDPLGRNSWYSSAWGERTVGQIQVEFQDRANLIHYQGWIPINLDVLHGVPTNESLRYVDEDGNTLDESEIHQPGVHWFRILEFDMVYTGVVRTGMIKITAQEHTTDRSSGFDSHLDLRDLEFTWTCHEARIMTNASAFEHILPLAPY